MYIIPAHSNSISQVKFEPQDGYFLVTASFDTTAKVGLYSSNHDYCPEEISLDSLVLSCLVSLKFDFLHQVWSSRDFKPVKTLSGHEARVTSLDVGGGEFLLAQKMQIIKSSIFNLSLSPEK